jgi:hypothetical protein
LLVSLARRLLASLLILLIALVSWLFPVTQAPAGSVAGNENAGVGGARAERRQGFLVVHLRGSPYEMGYEHGVLLRDAIRARIGEGLAGGVVQEGRVSALLLLRHAHQAESRIRREYREEMAGLADGAGVSYSDVLVLNTYDDLVSGPWPDESLHDLLLSLSPVFTPHLGPLGTFGGPGQDEQRATSTSGVLPNVAVKGAVALFGAATKDGRLLQVAGFGSTPAHPEQLVALVYQPEEGDSFVCLGPPGAVGCEVGLNEEQIAATALSSPSGDSSLEGVPLPFVLRDVLQGAGSIPEALTILASEGRTTGRNVLLGDGKRPDAQVVEFSTHLYAVFEAQNDFVARTNHFLDEGLAETQRSLSWWQGDESWAHLEELLRLLESGYGRFDVAAAMSLVRELASDGEQTAAPAGQSAALGVVLVPGDLEIRLVSASSGEESLVVRLDETP